LVVQRDKLCGNYSEISGRVEALKYYIEWYEEKIERLKAETAEDIAKLKARIEELELDERIMFFSRKEFVLHRLFSTGMPVRREA
jgi:hypothetical protein